MWTVLFGEHDAAAAASKEPLELLDDEPENQQPSPRNHHAHTAFGSIGAGAPHGKLRLSTTSTTASSPPLSPTSAADALRFSSESASTIRGSESSVLAPSPPGSSQGVRRGSGSVPNALPSATSSRRGSRSQAVDDDDAQQTPMAMLLRRLNQLMMKVGEHEFEKKTLVDGMEKDRERLTRQIAALQRELEDVKDQNVQLQYKLEYTTEPMLMEQLQDVTDMRDALTSVKVQLEREISEKDKALAESSDALAAKARELAELAHELHELECERDDLEQRVADAAKRADAETSAAFAAQLAAKDTDVAQLSTRCTALESELQQREQQLEELQIEREVTAQQHRDEVARLSDELTALTTQLEDAESVRQREVERAAALSACEQELLSRIAELEQQASEAKGAVSELTHTIEDYKEDCVQLWKTNEDLKQQLALASAETMLRDAEMRETALSGQTALLDKVNELEYELQMLHEQLDEKNQEVAKLQADAALAAAAPKPAPVTPVDQQAWKGGAIRVLTEQVVAAQRELSDAMDLNLHLNNRNTWLEEQHKQLSAASAAAISAAANTRALEATIAQLEQQLADQYEQCRTLAAQCSELESANAGMQSARSHAQEQLAQRTREWEALSREVTDLRSSSHAMARELQQLESVAAATAGTSDDLSKAQQQLVALQSELESARSAQRDAAARVEALHSSELELRAANEALAADRASAQNELAHTTATLRDDNRALQSELEALKAAYAEAMYYAERFRSTESELEAQRAAHDKVVSELHSVRDALTATEQQRTELEQRASEHEGAGAQRIADLTQQLAAAQLAASNAQAQCAAQTLDLASLEHQLKNLQAFSQETADEAESKLEDAMRDTDALRQALDAKTSECARMAADAQCAATLEHEVEAARQELSGITAQVQHLRGTEQQLAARLAQLTQSNEQLTMEATATKSERVTLEREVHALQTRLRDAEAARSELQREIDDAAAMHDADRAQRTQLEQQLAGARAELPKLQTQVESLTKKNLALRSEVESAREEAELKTDASQSLADNLRAELAAVRQQNQSELQRAQALAAQMQTENSRLACELTQVRTELEQLRAADYERAAANNSLCTELEQQRHELARLQHALEADASRAHTAEEQLAHATAATRELESALERSKQFCDDLSARCDEMQAYAKQIQDESQCEVQRLAHANDVLQRELDLFAQHRLREASAEEELHMHIAELQAENNVLAARAHRLTQQLSQFTDVPEEDRLADSHSQTPDLWELLSSGMEQLKADLELASKYAASIDANGLEVVDRSDEPLAIAS